MRKHEIEINHDQCIGCGMCIKDCPTNNLELVNKKAEVKTQGCIMCGHCVAVCPKAAVSITGFSEEPIPFDQPTVLDPTQLLDSIRTRRTIRQYKSQPIKPEIIDQIIEAGRLTPSGGNAQDVSYIVLQKDKKELEQVAVKIMRRLQSLVKLVSPIARNVEIDEDFFFKKAPVAIVVVSKDETNGALAASNMELMAEAHGLGVLYSGFFAKVVNHSPKLRRMLNIKHTVVVTTLVIGYPAVKYRRTAQKDPANVQYR